MRLFEARHIGSSKNVAWVMQTKAELQRRVDLVKKEKRENKSLNNWQDIGAWLNKQLPEKYGSVEDMFNDFQNVGMKEANKAVSDFTAHFGKPSLSHDWEEEIYSWKLDEDFILQVFTTTDEGLDLNPFMVVAHDFSHNPEHLEKL